MTTLTERLRELAALQYPYSGLTRGELADEAKDSIAVAQELHALLVECGERLKVEDQRAAALNTAEPIRRNVSLMLTKLKDAGIA